MPSPYSAIARLRIIGEIHGQETVNVLHFGTNVDVWDAPTAAIKLPQLIAAVIECIRETLLPALSSDWRLHKVTAQALYPVKGDEFEEFGVPADVGALGESSVSFASQMIALKTGLGGRSKRGRMFLPPPPESGVTNSRLTPGQILLIVAFVTCLANKFLAGGSELTDWRMAVFSRKIYGGILGNYNSATTECSKLTVNAVVSTVVRRKVGRGS